jgi:tetratricopeptide (TPR) repeat protein
MTQPSDPTRTFEGSPPQKSLAADPGPVHAENAIPRRLELLEEIARGGMGAILRARDSDIGRDVAVKVLLEDHQGKPQLAQRFLEEARIAGRLQHPGVAPVYALGRLPDGRPYFSMKLVKGRTLTTLMAERTEPGQERPRFLAIFEQVCQTLAYAHSKGVIHRDLKPSNVMVGAFGEVLVMDWGLAKVLTPDGTKAEPAPEPAAPAVSLLRTPRGEDGDAGSDGSETRAGSVLGTPAYMAPEQACGEVADVDRRADVFGLGAILCEMLTGKPPFPGPSETALKKARRADLGDAFARLDGCGADAELIALAKRCLAPKPEDRPRDAGEVAAAVTEYQRSVAERLRRAELARAAGEARAEEARATAKQERRARRLAVALAAAAVLLVVLGGGGWLWLQGQRAARLAENNGAVMEALNQATALRDQARPAENAAALSLLGRARDQALRAKALAQSGPTDAALAVQVSKLLAEVDVEADIRKQARGHHLYAINLRSIGNQDGADAEDRKAIDLDPTIAEAHAHLGVALQNEGKTDEAVASFRKAIEIDPGYGFAHHNLALALAAQGKMDEAAHEYCEVLRIDPAASQSRFLLCAIRARQGRLEEVRADWQKALESNPPNPNAWFGCAELCLFLGREDEYRRVRAAQLARFADATDPVVAERTSRACLLLPWSGEDLRRASALADRAAADTENRFHLFFDFAKGLAEYRNDRPEQAIPFLRKAAAFSSFRPVLAMALYRAGQKEEARQTLAELAALDQDEAHAGKVDDWIYFVFRREADVLITPNLSAVLKGDYQPKDNVERFDLARHCLFLKHFLAAARLYADAFAADPKTAASVTHYNAACCAARAGCGDGVDAKDLDDKDRAGWRKQALDWLRTDLAVWQKRLEGDTPEDRAAVVQQMHHWQEDADLAGLRDPAALAKLPADEQEACQKLWADVQALLDRAESKK